jgi:hypothetical protein
MMKPIIENKNIRWLVDGESRGYGRLQTDGTYTLQKCPQPECGLENYALNVLQGICTWCGFDANEVKNETNRS